MDAPTTSRDDIRRVLIAGDTHGNTAWVETLTRTAAALGCPVIIQLGDFSYFPRLPEGPHFLAAVDATCAANRVDSGSSTATMTITALSPSIDRPTLWSG